MKHSKAHVIFGDYTCKASGADVVFRQLRTNQLCGPLAHLEIVKPAFCIKVLYTIKKNAYTHRLTQQ